MADEAYYRWVNAGKPYRMARPIFDAVGLFRAAGYTVYHYPNTDHQQADPAEDHTPYSETGWPVMSKEWVAHAIDIMPTAGAPSLPDLARRIIADKKAGVNGTQWIKYINWTEEDGDCWHESWQPGYARKDSSDKGHIHISARSDMDDSDVVTRSGWNPVKELTMADITTHEVVNALANGSVDKGFIAGGDPYGWAQKYNLRLITDRLVEVEAQAKANAETLAELKALLVALTGMVEHLPQSPTVGGTLHLAGDLTVS